MAKTTTTPTGTDDRSPWHPQRLRYADALAVAARFHAGQVRKGTCIPYITHPVIVSETLTYHYPQDPALAIAGLLHDVVEDTDMTIDAVRTAFGDVVADLVAAATKPTEDEVLRSGRLRPRAQFAEDAAFERARWRVQREVMLEHLDPPDLAGPDAAHAAGGRRPAILRLKAADALANLRAIQRDLRRGLDVWSRFKVGRDESLWFYQEIEGRVRAGLPGEALASELREVLRAVAAHPAPVVGRQPG